MTKRGRPAEDEKLEQVGEGILQPGEASQVSGAEKGEEALEVPQTTAEPEETSAGANVLSPEDRAEADLLISQMLSGAVDPPEEAKPKEEVEQETSSPVIRPAVFEEFTPETGAQSSIGGLDLLLDVPLSVTVELGKARCYVRDILNLTVGSVIELEKLAGDPVDVLVNGKPIARGEVVVLDENFGVRIQEIIARPGKPRKERARQS